MKIIVTKTHEEACILVAERMAEVVKNKPNCKLGLATGSSCAAIYPFLVKAHKENGLDFSKVSTVNLDEYIGIDGNHDQSYRYAMNEWLFDHIDIDKKNTFVANGMAKDLQAEAALFKSKIHDGDAVDFQLLGVGISGHVGFNEAADQLVSGPHIEQLTEETIAANARFFADIKEVPTTAMTMGMGDILSAKEIYLVANGIHKAKAIKGLLKNEEITTHNPCTFLKLHPNVVVVIDEVLAKAIEE